MRRLIVAGLALACLCAPAWSQCYPAAFVLGQFEAHPSHGATYVATAEEAQRAVELFNAHPPQTNETFDGAMLLNAKNGEGVALFMRGDQVCASASFTENGWRDFVQAVRGEPT
jgi:hypothetical protein